MAAGKYDYSCFDFVLRADRGLPELAGTAAARPGSDIVQVTSGTVPDIAVEADPVAPELRVSDGQAVLTIPEVARFLIRDGVEIRVEPVAGSTESMVRLFLLGSALGVLCLQRGLLLLHANAVVMAGRAFAFAGHSGAGKSTLAGHFQRAGYPVLCDDVCGIRFDGAGVPLAWPGLPRLKLWREAAETLGHDPDAYNRVTEGHEKYQVPFQRAGSAEPVPLAGLYILERAASNGDSGIARLTGMAAMAAVIENSYRQAYLRPLGLAEAHFRQCVALLAHTGVYRATRRWGFDVFDNEVERIAAHATAVA